MKRNNILYASSALLMAFFSMTATAQVSQKEADWYNCSPEEDGVYGAAVNKAWEFLKDKPLKKTPIIAFIGTGMDTYHEDLKDAIWQNPAPTKGDVNGWNFIGGRDGERLVVTPSLADREYYRLKDKYADIIYADGTYWTVADGQTTEYTAPIDKEEYAYYDQLRQTNTSTAMQTRYSAVLSYFVRDFAKRAAASLQADSKRKDFEDWYKRGHFTSRLDSISFFILNVNWQVNEQMGKKEIGWGEYSPYYLGDEYTKYCQKKYNAVQTDFTIRQRIIGDHPDDLSDDQYGNNNLYADACMTEVLRASIAVGGRSNGLGADGIAPFARLMSLVAYPEKGDPYGKDIVLALRYAVDHGADIVVLAFQPRISSPQFRKDIYQELVRAEQKNVLVIIPAWESADDMDLPHNQYYPNRLMGGRELTNIIVVSPSDCYGKPSPMSNFGKQQVDLFAPGINIYAAVPGDSYAMGSGTALAAGTVAGVAALLRGYEPELSAGDIRQRLISTCTPRHEVVVEKSTHIGGKVGTDQFLFEELCLSGGIINAWRAVANVSDIRGERIRSEKVRSEKVSGEDLITSEEVFDYREVDGKIIIEVMADGKPQPFVLDLAGANAVTPAFAATLPLREKEHPQKTFLWKKVAVMDEQRTISHISYGNNAFRDDFPVLVLQDGSYLKKIGAVGVLNGKIFANACLTIDSRRKKITVSLPYKPAYMKLQNRGSFAFVPMGSGIFIPAKAGDEELSLQMDTWTDQDLVLNPEDYAKLKKEKVDVDIARHHLADMKVTEDGNAIKSMLGGGILRKGIVSIDIPHTRFFLQDFDEVAIPGNAVAATDDIEVKDGQMNPITRDYFLKNVYDYKNNKEFTFKGKMPVVIDFWATWCGPCMKLLPEMEKLAKKYEGKVLFMKVNADKEKELCNVFDISLLPTMLFVTADGKLIRDVCNDIDKIETIIKQQLLNEK